VQSTGPDPNLALHASTALPGHVLDVVVLTADAGLLATLREASAAEHAVWHAPSADAAVDLLIGGRCGVLIADLGALPGDAGPFFDRLHAQFPELVLMATGRRDEEGGVATMITRGVIYRLLHKPVSPARAGLFIAAATRRYHELRSVEPVGMATIKTTAVRPHAGKLAAIAATIIALAAATAYWLSRDEEAPALPKQESAIPAPTIAEQIATLLGRAQIAYARDQLSAPRGDNALEHYRAVLALDPANADAQQGVARVVAGLEAHVVAALQARNAPLGLSALAALQSAQRDHPRLDALRAELIALSRSAASASTAARMPPPRTSAAPAATAVKEPAASAPPVKAGPAAVSRAREDDGPASAPSEAEVSAVAQLREQGLLIAPPGANAYDALALLRAAFPGADEVRAEEQRLAFALLELTRTALAARDLENAAVYVQRADSLVPGMATTRALQQQLTKAQQERAFATNIVQAATLKRIREAAPVYPRDAARAGLEGWVDVEFTIALDGSTRDLVVRNADHEEVFGKAALDSVRRWRFEPVMRSGAAVEQRAILRVRFELK
jgi:TonB family protein